MLIEEYWEARHVQFDTKMAPHKAGRIEESVWNPPVLEFRITRHPGPWFRRQRWSFNFETDQVTLNGEWGERQNQSYTKAQRSADAEAIVKAMTQRQPHPAIRYQGATITVYLGRLPATRPEAYVLPKRTAAGRQQALKEAVAGLVAVERGFERVSDREGRSTLVFQLTDGSPH